MKFSEAMLRGYEKINGAQFFGGSYIPDGADPLNPPRACVLGAVNLGKYGRADVVYGADPAISDACERFEAVWGELPQELNDNLMPWEEIYGMSVAAGL
jgi:hypothetical protein